MAAFNFPNSPSTNDLHTENNVTWKWNGTVWKRINNSYLTASTLNVSGIGTFGGVLKIPTVAGTNTNAALNVLFQTATGVIDGGSNLTYNPGGDVLSVNGNHISINTFRGNGDLGTLTCDNHSSTTFVKVSSKVDLGLKDNTAGAFNVKEGSNEYITIDTTNSSELIKFGTAGSERLRITGNGLKVGTTVDNNYAAIHAHGGSATRLHLTSSNTGTTTSDGAIIMIDSSSNMEILNKENTNLEFFTNNSERLRISSAGRVLIGTTTEGHGNADDLTIATAGGSLGHTGITIRSGTSSDGNIFFSDATSGDGETKGVIKYAHNGDYLRFDAGGAERLRIASNGLLTINATTYDGLTINTTENGTNGPQVQLTHISASPAAADTIGQLRFSSRDSAGNTDLMAKIETVIDDPTSGQETAHLQFGTRGLTSYNPILRLKNRSTASAPSYTADDINGIILDVYNAGNPYPRYMSFIAKAGGNTDSNILFWTESVGGSPTEKLRITSAGHMGLGTNGPTKRLTVQAGSNNADIALFTGNDLNRGLLISTIAANSQNDMGVVYHAHGQHSGSYMGEHIFKTNNAERLRIKSAGLVEIPGDVMVSGSLYGGNGARRNWFDNGAMNVIQRYQNCHVAGNYHSYGWAIDRFQNRGGNSQWQRSTNVPSNKGFDYALKVGSGTGGSVCQGIELTHQGKAGPFAVGTFWCVSFWSTQPVNTGSNNGFCQDLSSANYVALSLRTPSSGNAYAETGETASGTASGTYKRYYAIFEVTSGPHANNHTLNFGWAFNYSGSGTSEWTGFQCEQVANASCKPSDYEHVDYATDLKRCQRYCWRSTAARYVNGYKRHDSQINFGIQCPVPMTPKTVSNGGGTIGVVSWDYGTLTDFGSVWQNPAATAIGLYEMDYDSGWCVINLTTAYTGCSHCLIPSWESAQFEVACGPF